MATSVDTLDTPICEARSQAQMFETPIEKPFTGKMESYHYAWLSVHPDRTADWLKARLRDGFHVHHIDGDHLNDAPRNLALIEGTDHMRLHGMSLVLGLRAGRAKRREAKETQPACPEARRIYEAKMEFAGGWTEFAQHYHDGVKPRETIWASLGSSLAARAKGHAKRNGLKWPPQLVVAALPPTEADIAAMVSRQ